MRILRDKALEYLHLFISLLKRWSNYFGFTLDKQNFEDTFFQLLYDKNYDEALKLAQQHKNLDIDLVYKCKWRNTGISIQLINNVMGKIQDKLWTVNECVQTVPITYQAGLHLLEYGLREANLRLLYELGNDSAQEQHSEGDRRRRTRSNKTSPLADGIEDEAIIGLIDFHHLNDQQKELCRCRQKLLCYMHSFEAYKTILGDIRSIQQGFDHVFYDEFRRKSPLESCIGFANMGDPHAVETCLIFYPANLKAHLLAILSNFPETLSPYQYRNLLPCLRGDQKVFEWQCVKCCEKQETELDWSALDRNELQQQAAASELDYYKSNEHLHKFSGPMTSDLLTRWYIERALEMDERTLLLSNAIQLLDLGMELNIKNLKATHDALTEFDQFVYDCCTDDIIYLSFKDVNSEPQIEKLLSQTFRSKEIKYKVFAFILANCRQLNDHMVVKILNDIILTRKRDDRIQLAYLELNQ